MKMTIGGKNIAVKNITSKNIVGKNITGKNIVKYYGDSFENNKVLDGVSIEIMEGEFICVMGPSGSGKSTLLFALSGMESIDGGMVTFDGTELSKLHEKDLADVRRTKMGFVFQQPTLLKNLNILDNIILPSMHDNKKNVVKIVERAKVLMKKTGIQNLEKRNITQVSGGQLQRAGICRALMQYPEIIFADEPTGALNSKSAQEIMDLFTHINTEGTAVMLVTHDVSIAARAERVMFMRDGKIVSEMKLPKYDGTNMEYRIKTITIKMQETGI